MEAKIRKRELLKLFNESGEFRSALDIVLSVCKQRKIYLDIYGGCLIAEDEEDGREICREQ